MYILYNGIKEIKKKSFIKRLMCKHEYVSGETCSNIGLRNISGERIVTICKHCGKISKDIFIKY